MSLNRLQTQDEISRFLNPTFQSLNITADESIGGNLTVTGTVTAGGGIISGPNISVNNISEFTASHGVDILNQLNVDNIGELTPAHDIVLLNDIEVNNIKSRTANSNLALIPNGTGKVSISSKLLVDEVNSLTTNGNLKLYPNGTGIVDVSNSLNFPTSVSASVGTIKQNNSVLLNTKGTNNIFFGIGSGNFTGTGANNIVLGNGVLANYTTGNNNVALGTSALTDATTGLQNTCIGIAAGQHLTTGQANTFVGYQANNVGVNTGTFNTGIGYKSLAAVTTGSLNSLLGAASGQAITTGANNVSIGANTLNSLTTGSSNIALGYQAGFNLTVNDSNNILIGHQGLSGDNNTIKIGTGITSCFINGINGFDASLGTAVYILGTDQIGILVSSKKYKENIEDLKLDRSNFDKLRPVKYNYINDEHKIINYGLIAEEVNDIFPELISKDKNNEILTVKYQNLYAMLIDEVQNLKKEISALKVLIK